VNDPDFWNKVLPFESIISISVLEKRFKKEKREMQTNEKMQKEFIKDLEIVFNDFIDAKFDTKTSNASKKQFESDEEKLREVLKKIAKMNGFKLLY
jgi:predicted ribosome quality control (RQC) complex YloA/Tae2 family protein